VNAPKANNTKEKVQKLQRKLYLAAKKASKRRFHALYDKVIRKDILEEAWKRVKANGGASGIDQISISDIESYGVEKFLAEIHDEMIEGRYRPQAVRRCYIPKNDGRGGKRPLGIPIIKDRVIQMAVKMVIEPLFEADFLECSYGFRPKRSAHQALDIIRRKTKNNGWWVVDADIKNYFGSIDHHKLMLLVEQRISDRRILKLIRKWLTAGVMEDGQYRETLIGSPQGGVISPLLSNIYLHYLDYKWEKHCNHLGTLVRYADDFVIICRAKKEAEHALKTVQSILEKLELTMHPEKTRLVNIWDGTQGFDFLGFHHRFRQSRTRTGQGYKEMHQVPSKKAMQKMRQNIKEVFANRARLTFDIQEMVKILNPKIIGMRNYYGLKNAGRQLNKIDWYIMTKFTLWYNHKKQRKPRHGYRSKVQEIIVQNGLQKLAG
jgi:RNA-directed DNA polymerase